MIRFQVNVTFYVVFLGHTEQAVYRIPNYSGGEPFQFILSFSLSLRRTRVFFFHHTMEFNLSIERKIYSQILLYAKLHLLRVRPRNFFRLWICSEFHSGSRVARKI